MLHRAAATALLQLCCTVLRSPLSCALLSSLCAVRSSLCLCLSVVLVLFCSVLCCIVLHCCTALCCAVLQPALCWPALCCTVLQYCAAATVLHCAGLHYGYWSALCCTPLCCVLWSSLCAVAGLRSSFSAVAAGCCSDLCALLQPLSVCAAQAIRVLRNALLCAIYTRSLWCWRCAVLFCALLVQPLCVLHCALPAVGQPLCCT